MKKISIMGPCSYSHIREMVENAVWEMRCLPEECREPIIFCEQKRKNQKTIKPKHVVIKNHKKPIQGRN